MEIIVPERLKEGDTVGIIAPSKGFDTTRANLEARLERGVKFLESLGLKVKFSDHMYVEAGKAADIHAMFMDDEVKMVMMAIGGAYINHVLPHIDYDLLRKHPKILSGMSDGTSLVHAVYKRAGLQTYYGVNVCDAIGFNPNEGTRQNFLDTFFTGGKVVMRENPHLDYHHWIKDEPMPERYEGWNVIRPGRAEGHLVGGYASRLIDLDYEGFTVDYGGAILFIETQDELSRFALTLSVMEQRGVFKGINGLICGYSSGIARQEDAADMLKFVLKGYDFPIVQIGELGHDTECYSFPLGARAEMDTDTRRITVDMGG